MCVKTDVSQTGKLYIVLQAMKYSRIQFKQMSPTNKRSFLNKEEIPEIQDYLK